MMILNHRYDLGLFNHIWTYLLFLLLFASFLLWLLNHDLNDLHYYYDDYLRSQMYMIDVTFLLISLILLLFGKQF